MFEHRSPERIDVHRATGRWVARADRDKVYPGPAVEASLCA
jgi:hypothetical protein